MQREDKLLGCLAGAAIGDSMGGPTEERSTEMILEDFGGYVTDFRDAPLDTWAYGAKAGMVTDDFSLAYFTQMCIRDSLLGDGTGDLFAHPQGVGGGEDGHLSVRPLKVGQPVLAWVHRRFGRHKGRRRPLFGILDGGLRLLPVQDGVAKRAGVSPAARHRGQRCPTAGAIALF